MNIKLALAAIITIMGLASHASANVVTVTYFGIVNNTQNIDGYTEPAPDYDLADLFGGGNLEGDLVEATFVYDTTLGLPETDSGVYDELNGGLAFGAPSPLLSASLTVQQATTLDLYSYTFTPDYYAVVYTSADQIADIGYSTAGDQTYAYIDTNGSPTSLAQSYFPSAGYGPGSYFDPGMTNTGSPDTIVFDALAVEVSSVPEPGAWALMIVGIALTGGTARRGRRRRVVALPSARS
jgi:hypothetical protein